MTGEVESYEPCPAISFFMLCEHGDVLYSVFKCEIKCVCINHGYFFALSVSLKLIKIAFAFSVIPASVKRFLFIIMQP